MTRLWVIAALTVAVGIACDKVPLTSPTGSTIVLSIDRDILPINGQATLVAVVTESAGTAVQNGTTVTFATSLGRTSPIEAQTVNGKATVTFLAGTISGTANISAFSGAARTGSGNSSAGGLTVRIGTAGTERVSVRTEPLNVPVTGGTVTVVAAIFDAGGNPIINTPVTFASDFGSLSANVATTDANGEARVQLTTNRTTRITVTSGSKTGEFTLSALTPPSVTLNCGSSNTATVGVPINCTITPTVSGNGSSSAPIQNLTINWGDGTGEQPLGNLNSATVVGHTYTSPGSFQVTASATDVNSQRGSAVVTLNVTRSLPTITFSTCPGTATVGVPVAFAVTPAANPAIPLQDVTVSFGDGSSRDLGQITGPTAFTKSFGAEGGYTVTATVTDTAGQRGSSSCAVIVSRGTAPTVTFTQTSTSGTATIGVPESFTISATPANGLSIRQVVVTIDRNGQEVYNSTSGGAFATDRVQNGDVLTARVVDSAGNTTTSQLVVQ